MQCLDKKAITNQSDLYSHSEFELSENKSFFESNDEVLDIENIKICDSEKQCQFS